MGEGGGNDRKDKMSMLENTGMEGFVFVREEKMK